MYEYSCSYIEHAGYFHGETAEHEWVELNQVASQTRQMNNGHRQDVLIDHHSDWNWKKVANMGMLPWVLQLTCIDMIPILLTLAGSLSMQIVYA